LLTGWKALDTQNNSLTINLSEEDGKPVVFTMMIYVLEAARSSETWVPHITTGSQNPEGHDRKDLYNCLRDYQTDTIVRPKQVIHWP